MNLPSRRVPNQTSVFVLFLPIFGLSVFPCVFLCSCVFVFCFCLCFFFEEKLVFIIFHSLFLMCCVSFVL